MDHPAAGRDAVAIAFLKRYLDDRANAVPRSLGDYQAMFPGFEGFIAEEYEKVAVEEAPSSTDLSGSDATVGRYRLLRSLGRGGQADVFLAEDSKLGRQVAIKVLRRWVGAPQAVLKRFQREAALASRLDHPSISTVFETGLDDGVPYIVMRYVEGETLGEMIPTVAGGDSTSGEVTTKSGTSRGSIRRFARIVEQTARAVHSAHAENVLHRDLKPSNILITPDDTPVVVDFGLARSLDHETDATFTQPGDLFGTPSYMSPEQLTAHHVTLDARTDVYSLGVTLYECLTNRRPFEAPTREGLYQAILTKPAIEPRKLNSAVPRDLELIVETAMAKDRDHRYQTALDFAEDLARWQADEPIQARAVGPIGRLVRWARREPIRAGFVAACLVIAAGGGYAIAAWPQVRADRAIAESLRQTEEIERHLSDGYQAIADQEPADAIPAFARALAIDPHAPEAIVGRVLAELWGGDGQTALRLADAHETTTDRRFDRVRCEVLRTLGREADAKRLEETLQEPADHLEHFVAAVILLTHAKEARDRQIGRRGLEQIERAILLAPRSRPLYVNLFAEFAGQIEDERAARHAAAALKRRGLDQRSAQFLFAYATSVFDPDEGIALYRAILEKGAHVPAMGNLASLFADKGQHDKALTVMRKLREHRPNNADLANNHALFAVEANRRKEAIDAMQAFRRLEPGNLRWHQRLGNFLFAEERYVEALDVCQDAIRVEPDNPLHEGNLALTLLKLGRHDDAIEAIRRAIRIRPDEPRFHHQLGNMLMRAKDYDGAAIAYRKVAALKPGDADTLFQLSGALLRAGATAEAVKILQELLSLEDSYRVRYQLGYVFNKIERYADGENAYRAAIAHRKTADAYLNLGVSLGQLHRYGEAVAAMRRSIEIRGKPWSKSQMDYYKKLVRRASEETELSDYASGALTAPDFDQLFALLQVAGRKRLFPVVARLWREAVDRFESRTLARDPMARIRGAVAAIQSAQEADVDDESRWRTQALQLLRAELQDATAAHTAGAIDDQELHRRAKQLRRIPQFREMRSRQHLATLPDEESEAWIAFWRAVGAAEKSTKP